ncbi:MAG: four helix bundle protein [Chitinophagaceae bacterium]|nr:four helix bundle protein [Chitinophagaceae bacterium]
MLEDLVLYQKAVALRKKIQSIANTFPKEEQFHLKSQLKRSIRSVSANIAEGYGRYHFQENIQFLRVARGSLFESMDHLGVAEEEGYIGEEERNTVVAEIYEAIKIVNGYISYLQKQKAQSGNNLE